MIVTCGFVAETLSVHATDKNYHGGGDRENIFCKQCKLNLFLYFYVLVKFTNDSCVFQFPHAAESAYKGNNRFCQMFLHVPRFSLSTETFSIRSLQYLFIAIATHFDMQYIKFMYF